MTEAEWATTGRFRESLEAVFLPPAPGFVGRVRAWAAGRGRRPAVSARRTLLVVAAVGRRLWAATGHGAEDGHREWADRCERYADGSATAADRTEVGRPTEPRPAVLAEYLFYQAALRAPAAPAEAVLRTRAELWPGMPVLAALLRDYFPEESAAGCAALREVLGNPFRAVTFSPEWRTDTAVTLARTMYESRDFSAMPILADALQDAGCDSADVLDHCREAGGGSGEPAGGSPVQAMHVRGCWVCDLVLGKE